MPDRIYRSEAIILRRSDFSEADRLLLLVTPGGKRRVVAKGIRKTSSRLAGHLELFTHTGLLLAIGRNLDIVTQSQTLHSFERMRSDLGRLSCAYYVAELYDRLIQEEEANPAVFRLMLRTCAALDRSAQLDLALRVFELGLLQLVGYRPQLHRCPVCQELLSEDADRFSPSLGGVICPRDAAVDRSALPISLGAFKLLRYLQTGGSNDDAFAAVEQMQLSAGLRREAGQLLRNYVRTILERDLRSVAFLEDILRDYGLQP
jgi:DNA repair protein RecO (recombination protein O)